MEPLVASYNRSNRIPTGSASQQEKATALMAYRHGEIDNIMTCTLTCRHDIFVAVCQLWNLISAPWASKRASADRI